jgi:uncharacterized protein YwgA
MPTNYEIVENIVADAGGRIVGRTKLQKIGYLLSAAGFDDTFEFEYRHYGPYSEELADAARFAPIFCNLCEAERVAEWGGSYSIFTTETARSADAPEGRLRLIEIANDADPVELELAATAIFLAKEGYDDPWEETAERKPEKAARGRLARAKRLYAELAEIDVPRPLPQF